MLNDIKCQILLFVFLMLSSCILRKDNTVTELIDTRDGKVYQCKKIGDQVWMVENLAYQSESVDAVYYGVDSLKNYSYGCLYFDKDVLEATNIEGWHLPDTAEWNQLLSYYNLQGGRFGQRNRSHNYEAWESKHEVEIAHFMTNEKDGFNFQFGGLWHLKWLNPTSKRQRCFEQKQQAGYYWVAPLSQTNSLTHFGMGRHKYYWLELNADKPSSVYKPGEEYRFSIRLAKD